jgi:hypothetical protein
MSMNYHDARWQIRDGDLIAVRGKGGIIGSLTRFFTRSPYTHAAVAVWFDGGLYMAELNGGRNHLVPVSQIADEDFDVCWCPVREPYCVRRAVEYWLRHEVPYGYLAFILIGLSNFLRLDVRGRVGGMLVCSSYCAAVYQSAGWKKRNRIVSPADLVGMLKMKLQVRQTSKPKPPPGGFFMSLCR